MMAKSIDIRCKKITSLRHEQKMLMVSEKYHLQFCPSMSSLDSSVSGDKLSTGSSFLSFGSSLRKSCNSITIEDGNSDEDQKPFVLEDSNLPTMTGISRTPKS